MSPGKCISPPPTMIIAGRLSPIITAQRSLNFATAAMNEKSCSPNGVLSWADKVKGLKPMTTNSQQDAGMENDKSHEITPEKTAQLNADEEMNIGMKETEFRVENNDQNNDDDYNDDDGWEIVGRGKHRSRGSSTSMSLKTSASQDSVETAPNKNDHVNERKSLSYGSPEKVIATFGSAFERVEKTSPKAKPFSSEKQSPSQGEMVRKEEVDENNLVITERSEIEDERILDVNKESNDLSLDLSVAENYDELMLQAEMDGLMQSEEQQEEDMISRKMEEENEKALASAIEEEEHLTKELEDEALKNTDDEFTEDVSSDKEGNNTDEGQFTPRDANELDESVSHKIVL